MDSIGFAISTFPRTSEDDDAVRNMAIRQSPVIEVQHPGKVLIFRTREGYEAFGDHAESVIETAGIEQQGAYRNDKGRYYAHVVFHPKAAEGVISALIAAGHKVAVCERYGATIE